VIAGHRVVFQIGVNNHGVRLPMGLLLVNFTDFFCNARVGNASHRVFQIGVNNSVSKPPL
jgi:hypothetical protein